VLLHHRSDSGVQRLVKIFDHYGLYLFAMHVL
jgi:hypothetical protein